MKKIIWFFCIFFATFTTGYLVVPTFMKPIEKQEVVNVVDKEILIQSKPQSQELIEETEKTGFDSEQNFKIKLLETGSFHGDEVNAKSGETWTGLFREGNSYFLRNTKIKVTRVHDEITDEKEWQKTGKAVTVNSKSPNVFLLRNALKLKTGKVQTWLDSSQAETPINMPNGFAKEFKFNGEKYTLRVENKTSKEEFLNENSKLILSNRNSSQVLATLKNGCDDCYWSMIWVGDLDRDGKPDFYFNLSNHYNISAKALFLSSQAEKNKLVIKVAILRTVGC